MLQFACLDCELDDRLVVRLIEVEEVSERGVQRDEHVPKREARVSVLAVGLDVVDVELVLVDNDENSARRVGFVDLLEGDQRLACGTTWSVVCVSMVEAPVVDSISV